MMRNRTVSIKHVGTIEVPGKRGYRLADGWAVVVDGRELFPWLPKRKAQALAKSLRAKP